MDTRFLGDMVSPLLNWYELNKRALPWRADREPYHVWISEIMLQQTRIEAVMGYYARFLEALPTVESLAAVSDEKLMKLWEGLGYYSRARNLKKAAIMMMEQYGGVFPTTYDELVKLPGIGAYTAGAIASICFQQPVTAVDGNVLRVLARLTGDKKNVLLPQTKKQAEAALLAVMPAQSGAFNEALMELGETVCLPNGAPLCDACPLSCLCIAKRENLTAELPVRMKDTTRRKEVKTVLILQTPQGEIALRRREKKGLLAGLYELPNLDGKFSVEALQAVFSEWGLAAERITPLPPVKHIFTHIEWQMHSVSVAVKEKNDAFIWAPPATLAEEYALPTAFQKCLK